MNSITIGRFKYKSPSSWAEMTVNQAAIAAQCVLQIFIMSRIAAPIETIYTLRNQLAVRLIPSFLRVSWFWMKLMGKYMPDTIAEISTLNDFVFDSDPPKKVLLQSLRINKLLMHGPADKMYTSTIEEFAQTERLFELWSYDPSNEAYINAICANLYRPAAKKGTPRFFDKRESFDREKAIAMAPKWEKAPKQAKALIMLQYIAARNMIIESFPFVFQNVKKKAPQKSTWHQVVIEMSGQKFGDFNSTRKTMLWDFLGTLNLQMKQAEELKKKQK